MKRLARGIALAAVLCLGLTGCVGAFRPPSTSSTSTPSPESVNSDLSPYYKQTLRWKACSGTFDCATAIAPEDWSDPGGKRIELALIRHRATGDRKGSLIVNPGGPGGSGYDFIRDSLDFATDSTLQRSYDVVGFDPRGVNHSTPVSCYPDDDQLTSFLFPDLPGAVGSASWIATSTQRYTDFAAACAKNTGSLLAHVDTISTVRDLDMLRAALGDRKLNYLGYSYGTLIGSTYAGMFPRKTGRLVLDGALDPSSTLDDVLVGQAGGFEGAFRSYLKDCLTRSSCPFRGRTVDESLVLVRQLLTQVQQTPIRNSDGRELNASVLFTSIAFPLYNQGNWRYEDALFADIRKGSAKVAFQLADQYYERQADGSYADNSAEAFSAINCLDYPVETDAAALRAQAAKIVAAAPTFGLEFSYDYTCVTWPYPPTRTPGAISAAGSAPIVVVGTTGDPATPYKWAQGLASQLDNGHLVTYRGEGHTAYGSGNDCVDGAVDSFLVDGTVPKDGLTCG